MKIIKDSFNTRLLSRKYKEKIEAIQMDAGTTPAMVYYKAEKMNSVFRNTKKYFTINDAETALREMIILKASDSRLSDPVFFNQLCTAFSEAVNIITRQKKP